MNKLYTVALLLALNGCDGGSEDPVPMPPDAEIGAWGPARSLDVTVTIERYPAITGDGLELYYSCNGCLRAAAKIYRRTRTTPEAAWGEGVPVAELNTPTPDNLYDWTTRFSPDGRTVHFVSERAGGMGGADIWTASRDDLQSPFGPPSPVEWLNSVDDDRGPSSCAGGSRFVFESNRSDGTNQELYEATADGTIVPIGELNSEQREAGPFITEDCLTLYFASDRDLSFDLFVAERASVDEPFGAPTRIDELSDERDIESDPWVSSDQRHILFSSGEVDADLYEAFR